MPASPLDPRVSTPAELRERIGADRRGLPYLVLRDGDGRQRLVELGGEPRRLTIGRALPCDVALDWDAGVSRVHAELELLGVDWAFSDDGLSRNGSFVNGERVTGRRLLADGDVLRVGDTLIVFRSCAQEIEETAPVGGIPADIALTPGQRRVLVALCRPYGEGGRHATPATNRQIAEELVVSVEAVKTQLRALFAKLGVEPDLPHNRKRARLAELALESGLITPRDIAPR